MSVTGSLRIPRCAVDDKMSVVVLALIILLLEALCYSIISSFALHRFGTLIFCAPELFGQGPSKYARFCHSSFYAAHLILFARFSVQSDIYAYGMFLYEVMTHHFPFENFVTETPDGRLLSPRSYHWEFRDIHKPHANERLALRYHKVASLCIPEAILCESPNGFVELLKNCIAVRLWLC